MLKKFYDLLSYLNNTPSKNEKLEILKVHGGPFRELFKWALSPQITFGVAKLPLPEQGLPHIYVLERFLEELATRRLSGNAALREISAQLGSMDRDSAAALSRILLKDLRCGVGADLVNKALPGTVPVTPYMRCSLPKQVKLKDWPWEQGVVSQVKADGMFAYVTDSSVMSRNGSLFDVTKFKELFFNPIPAGIVICGELLLYKRDLSLLPREKSNGIFNSVLKGGDFPEGLRIGYEAWDVILLKYFDTKSTDGMPYIDRLDDLRSIKLSVIETRIVHSMDEALAHYREVLSRGGEGTVLKHPGGIWRDGTSREQVKLKLEVDVDLMIMGFTPGKGKFANTFGAMVCASKGKDLIVQVSGFTDAQRADFSKRRFELLGGIVTVKANSVMLGTPASLFLPRFVELRLDKSEPDTLEQIIAQFEGATK